MCLVKRRALANVFYDSTSKRSLLTYVWVLSINHHPKTLSTSLKKSARLFFIDAEPISAYATARQIIRLSARSVLRMRRQRDRRFCCCRAFYAVVFVLQHTAHLDALNTTLKRIYKLLGMRCNLLIFNKSAIHRQLIGFHLLTTH